MACKVNEPESIEEALHGEHAEEWKTAMDREYDSLMENNTWELVEMPSGKNVVGCRWIFKANYASNGEVNLFKARLVAKGYTQRYGIDYHETYLPVVRFTSVRMVLAVAVQKSMYIQQMVVKTAFLNGTLNEEIYMEQPKGYVQMNTTTLVCKLKKSLYGLKQSPRCWNTVLHDYLQDIGFERSNADPCVYIRAGESLLIIAVYVDDLIMSAESWDELIEVKETFAQRFKMEDMGQLHYCLGVSVEQDTENKCVRLHQKQYILKLLDRYGLNETKMFATPSDTSVKLKIEDGANKCVDAVRYQSMTGSLLYAAMGTRLDVAFAVSAASKFNSNPSKTHETAVKRIFQYLKYTAELTLCYQKSEDNCLLGFSDADWAGNQDDRHSTTGILFKLSGGAVSWMSKKQSVAALSTAEVEYVALSAATQEAIWLKRMVEELNLPQDDPTTLKEDNQGAIAIAKNPVSHGRTKHIDIDIVLCEKLYATEL